MDTITIAGMSINVADNIEHSPATSQDINPEGLRLILKKLEKTLNRSSDTMSENQRMMYNSTSYHYDVTDSPLLTAIGIHPKHAPKDSPYRGKFIKRITQYYHKEYGESKLFDSDILGSIGGIIGEYKCSPMPYYFRIVPAFDWKRGKFGDSNSCFWTLYKHARRTIVENGGYTMQVYRMDDDYPVARAVLLSYNTRDTFIVCNSYGRMSRTESAYYLASYLGLQYKSYSVRESSGKIWINGHRGFVLGNDKLFDEIESSWDNAAIRLRYISYTSNDSYHSHDDDDEGPICERCESDDNLFYVGCLDGTYCYSCATEYYDAVHYEDQWYSGDDCVYIEEEGMIPYNVAEEYYTECQECNEYRSNDIMESYDLPANGDMWLCETCFDAEFVNCARCESVQYQHAFVWNDDICRECIKADIITVKRYADGFEHCIVSMQRLVKLWGFGLKNGKSHNGIVSVVDNILRYKGYIIGVPSISGARKITTPAWTTFRGRAGVTLPTFDMRILERIYNQRLYAPIIGSRFIVHNASDVLPYDRSRHANFRQTIGDIRRLSRNARMELALMRVESGLMPSLQDYHLSIIRESERV